VLGRKVKEIQGKARSSSKYKEKHKTHGGVDNGRCKRQHRNWGFAQSLTQPVASGSTLRKEENVLRYKHLLKRKMSWLL
jgi:hypothetical protein